MPQNTPDTALWCIIGTISLFLAIVIIYGLTTALPKFLFELKTINIEIGRTNGIERKYWKRQKRKLLLSILPFVKYK